MASATGKSNKAFRFAKVDSNFAAFLPYLKDGAVKLYLYYAVVANTTLVNPGIVLTQSAKSLEPPKEVSVTGTTS